MLSWFRNEAGHFLDFVDQRRIVRRVFIFVVLWQFIDVYLFAKDLAGSNASSGVELAAVIGALTLPITALSGFLFKLYSGERSR